MLRFMCTNPWCLDRWHYSPSCPYRVPRSLDPIRRPLPPPSPAVVEWQLEKQRKAARAAEEQRRVQDFVRNPNDPPPPPPMPSGSGWLLAVCACFGVLLAITVLIALCQ